MADTIRAPWTAAQVDNLNRFQRSGLVHPFTCPGHDAGDRDLVATRAGFICCHCGYRQDWAHAFMGEFDAAAEEQMAAGLGKLRT